MLLPATIAVLLVTGMGLALLGSVKLPLARKLQIDEARVGGLISLFGFTMIPVILAAGFLTDEFGRQAVLCGGGILMVVSLIVLARAKTYAATLISVLLLSAAWSAQVNVVNVLTPVAFSGSEARALNLGNFFFGLGAFLTPVIITTLLRKADLAKALFLLAAAVLVSVGMAYSIDFSAIKPETPDTKTVQEAIPGFGTLLGDPIMWLCALALFFYGPIEAAIAAWSTTYLGDKGVGESRASGFLSGFWLAFMMSRLMIALTVATAIEGREAQLILVMAISSVGVLIGIVFGRSRMLAMTMVILAGFALGPIFPTIMAVLLSHFDKSVHGRAVGLFFAIGGIGWTTIPMLMGAYARRTSVQKSFLIAVASAVGLCAIAAILVFYTARLAA